MGKATRWIKGLLGMKKDKENIETDSNKKEKKRWSFVKSARESSSSSALKEIPAAADCASSWLRSYMAESERDQNQHAIAVAAATAAAADAAVAAAHAAVAVVRLTSQGRGGALFAGGREKFAAVKIQTVFRGYLARKALRALKGLVKLQALVRGYLVRKRAAATLHSMQALFRAQATIRARRSTRNDRRFGPESRAQRPFEARGELFHSKRHSTSYDPCNYNPFEESPKIVEVDTGCGPNSRSRRISTENLDDQYYHMMSSPLPCPNCSGHLRIPSRRHNRARDYDWGFIEEDYYKFSTAQSTPRFAFAGRENCVLPVTPSKSVCGDGFIGGYYGNCPSYMANTQSFNAKLRWHSAPKQRPEPGPKKRLSLTDIMAARSSFSGVRMQRRSSCSQVREDFEL